MTTPSQAEELSNTVPIRYLPYHPSGPRRLPFQNLQQLHVSDLMAIVCAVNKHQYEERIPRQVVRDLTSLVTTNPLLRRFFRDAFWWLYLTHFADIDLELLLNVAKQNVLLSSADAALMSMEAIRKRTAAMAPKMPPSVALSTQQKKQQQQEKHSQSNTTVASSSLVPRDHRPSLTNGSSSGGQRVGVEGNEGEQGGRNGSITASLRNSSVDIAPNNGMNDDIASTTMPRCKKGREDRMSAAFFPQRKVSIAKELPFATTEEEAGENALTVEQSEDVARDRYRQRMVSLQNDTLTKLEGTRKKRESSVASSNVAAAAAIPHPPQSQLTATNTQQRSGGAKTTLPRKRDDTVVKNKGAVRVESGGVVIAPMPAHLSTKAGNRTTQQLAYVASPATRDTVELAHIVKRNAAATTTVMTIVEGGGKLSASINNASSSNASLSPRSINSPLTPHSSSHPEGDSNSMKSPQQASPPKHGSNDADTKVARRGRRYVTSFKQQRVRSATGHSDTDTTDRDDDEEGQGQEGSSRPRRECAAGETESEEKKTIVVGGGSSSSTNRTPRPPPRPLVPAALLEGGASPQQQQSSMKQQANNNDNAHRSHEKRDANTPPKHLRFNLDHTVTSPTYSSKGDAHGAGYGLDSPSVSGYFVAEEESSRKDDPTTTAMGMISSGDDDDDESLSEAMTLRSFKPTLIEDTEEEADDDYNYDKKGTKKPDNMYRNKLLLLSTPTEYPMSPGSIATQQKGGKKAVAIRGVNLAILDDDSDGEEGLNENSSSLSRSAARRLAKHQRKLEFVQAEHHKLFSRMAMNYGQLLLDLIHGTAVGSSNRITTRKPSPTRGNGGKKNDESGKEEGGNATAAVGAATSPARPATSPSAAAAAVTIAPPPKLGRFEATVHRDVLIGYLPDLLSQGLFLAFALALPFTHGTLLDADFQLSILRHVTFWMHGVESTHRFIVGSTMQITQQSPQQQMMAEQQRAMLLAQQQQQQQQGGGGKDVKLIASGHLPPSLPQKAPTAASPPSSPRSAAAAKVPYSPIAVLTTVQLPAVTASSRRHIANPTLAAQDARSFKLSAGVSSWPVNAVLTVIWRRRKEFWQSVKEGLANSVSDYPLADLQSLRLVLRRAKITSSGTFQRLDRQKKHHPTSTEGDEQRTDSGNKALQHPLAASGIASSKALTMNGEKNVNAFAMAIQSPRGRTSTLNGDSLATSSTAVASDLKRVGSASISSLPPSRATSASRRRGGGGPANASLINHLQQTKSSTREDIVDRQVMAFNREMQRIHTTHTFASLNTVATGGTGGDIFDAPPPSASSRDKNAVGASSRGMDAFLDTLARKQRRESQSARQGSPQGGGDASANGASSSLVTRFGTAAATGHHAKLLASQQILASHGIDISGQITTVRNVHTIKKELDDLHQPVAPWFMKSDARVRKRTGALYYLNGSGGGSSTLSSANDADTSTKKESESANDASGKSGSKKKEDVLLVPSNPAAACPATARFTLTNWSPLIQRYMLLLGGKNSATPESMAWTLTGQGN